MAKTTHLKVAFYVPNIIGYSRFLFLSAAPMFIFDEDKWYMFICFYLASELLDAVDGNAARAFD